MFESIINSLKYSDISITLALIAFLWLFSSLIENSQRKSEEKLQAALIDKLDKIEKKIEVIERGLYGLKICQEKTELKLQKKLDETSDKIQSIHIGVCTILRK